jgi:hypothetical protein
MNEQRAVIQQMVDALDHADELLGGNDTLVMNGAAAGRWLLEQPAVQEPVAQSLKDAVFTVIEGFNIPPDVRKILESAYYNAPPAPQPVPVKTYHDGKPWPVQPKPWVGLTDEEAQWIYDNGRTPSGMMEMVEAKLKEKNT